MMKENTKNINKEKADKELHVKCNGVRNETKKVRKELGEIKNLLRKLTNVLIEQQTHPQNGIIYKKSDFSGPTTTDHTWYNGDWTGGSTEQKPCTCGQREVCTD